MKFHVAVFVVLLLTLGEAHPALAAYESRFDAVNFSPAVDKTPFFTVYGAQTLKAWQGQAGFSLDYAAEPLRFTGTGAFAGTNPSVIDSAVTANVFGAIGFLDWFTAGMNVPIVLFNDFFADTPVTAPTGLSDSGASMGDVQIITKFRLLDVAKHHVGVAIIPTLTFPTGDVVRYAGSGHLTGGATIAAEFAPGDRVRIGLNLGTVLRDNVLRHGVDMSHQLTYGLGGDVHFGKGWHGIAEGYGSTVFKNFFAQAVSPLELGGGIRYDIGKSGISLMLAGFGGLRTGVGNPKFRLAGGLSWTSPGQALCAPAPDPRIRGESIVLMGKIYYDTAKATIKPVSFPVLDDVVDVMNKHPELTLVEVQGHTDARASIDYNRQLSQARAESALNYLTGKGVATARLRAVGYGESRPIAGNDTAQGMRQNRRTEFVIISSTADDIHSAPTSSAGGVTPATTVSTDAGGVPNYSYPPAQ